jgi:hypothetical protein
MAARPSVADLRVGADVVEHPLVVVADGVPAAADHRVALAGAEAAVHGADVRGLHQRAVGVAVRQPRDRHVLVFFEGVFQLVAGGVLGLPRAGHRLQPDRVVRVGGVDEREVIRRDGELVVAFERADGFQLLVRERQQFAELADGTEGVLGLPAPIVPVMVGGVLPERMTAGSARRFFVVEGAGRRRGERPRVQPGALLRLTHDSYSLQGFGEGRSGRRRAGGGRSSGRRQDRAASETR